MTIQKLTHKLDELLNYKDKMVIIKFRPTYYDDIKFYLQSLKNATNKDNKIGWNKIIYPSDLFKSSDTKKKETKELKISD